VIAAVLADLQRFFEVWLKERSIALEAFDEDAFSLNAPFVGGH
jgi:predicted HTH domain antitoxin